MIDINVCFLPGLVSLKNIAVSLWNVFVDLKHFKNWLKIVF